MFGQGTPAKSLDHRELDHAGVAAFPRRAAASASPTAQLADLDRDFGLTESGNSEILFAWLRIAIRTTIDRRCPRSSGSSPSQGRRKFLRPLYEDLMATDWGKAEAKRIYARARPTYHAVATTTLDAIVR